MGADITALEVICATFTSTMVMNFISKQIAIAGVYSPMKVIISFRICRMSKMSIYALVVEAMMKTN